LGVTVQPSLDGVLAAGAQVAAGELAAAVLPGARSPVTGLGRTLIDQTPGPVVDITVALLEARDKPLLMATVLGGFAGVGSVAGQVRARHPARARALIAAQGVVAGAGAASRPDASVAGSLAAGLAGAAAGVAALEALARWPAARARPAVAALSLAAGAAASRVRTRSTERLLDRRSAVTLPSPADPLPPPASEASLAVDGISPLHTPNASFYETDVTFPPPVLDVEGWRLRIHGLVEQPVELSFDELVQLGVEERDTTLVCVHNPIGGPRIGTARWLGVPVARLLRLAGPLAEADQLVARSVDGFTAGVPLSLLEDERAALVVVGMNGEPLPVEHGFPARLLVPGLYGYDANTKWLGDLELATFHSVSDYWTRRGWPREPAPVVPGARIDVPKHRHTVAAGPVTVAGVAWAPPRGVRAVEVSVDGTPWQPAELARELDPAAWRQWLLRAKLAPGEHELRVRTSGQDVDSTGSTPPYPYGASGVHTVTVRARDSVSGGPPGRITSARVAAGQRARLAAQGAVAWARHYTRVRGA
jgi:DMSO/TMAO reductase YedYZ molybdopterin-dependent catalytic subunit